MSRDEDCILVVEDEPFQAEVLRVLLETHGYSVCVARDGEAALQLASRKDLALIVLDVRMPGLDGHEVCRRVRGFSTVPIIFLTALAQEDDLVKGLGVGADDYVTKPFDPHELVARVRAVLRRVEFARRGAAHPLWGARGLQADLVRPC